MIAVPMALRNFDQCHPLDPGGGANFNYTVYAGYSHLFIAVEYTLVCDGTVISRVPGLVFEVDGHEYHISYSANANAGATRTLDWYAGIDRTPDAWIVNNRLQLPLPCPLYLRAGDHIKSKVINIQAGDQITAIYLYQYVFRTT